MPESEAVILVVVDTGGGVEAREIGGAEEDVPDGEDGGEVAGLVVMEGVVGAMKQGTDEEAVSDAAETHADVGVGEAFEGPGGECDH